jgi:hypothetical protein
LEWGRGRVGQGGLGASGRAGFDVGSVCVPCPSCSWRDEAIATPAKCSPQQSQESGRASPLQLFIVSKNHFHLNTSLICFRPHVLNRTQGPQPHRPGAPYARLRQRGDAQPHGQPVLHGAAPKQPHRGHTGRGAPAAATQAAAARPSATFAAAATTAAPPRPAAVSPACPRRSCTAVPAPPASRDQQAHVSGPFSLPPIPHSFPFRLPYFLSAGAARVGQRSDATRGFLKDCDRLPPFPRLSISLPFSFSLPPFI